MSSFDEILKEEDSGKLFEFCTKYDIPQQYRGEIWLKLLNVQISNEDFKGIPFSSNFFLNF